MQNRIKELRKSLGLNQTEFGAKLGIASSTIAGYEIGARTPSDAIIKSICREYGVNETWLRTGAGEMRRSRSREAELGDGIRRILVDRPESFQAELITTLLKFDPDGPEWAALEKILRSLVRDGESAKDPETQKDPDAPAPKTQKDPEP